MQFLLSAENAVATSGKFPYIFPPFLPAFAQFLTNCIVALADLTFEISVSTRGKCGTYELKVGRPRLFLLLHIGG